MKVGHHSDSILSARGYSSGIHVIVKWFASNMIYLTEPLTIVTSGSGDTTFHYILLLCIFTTSVLGTVIWSLNDSKRKNHNQLFYWLTVVIRFYVGSRNRYPIWDMHVHLTIQYPSATFRLFLPPQAFWIVAILGRKAIWYSDTEEGFNVLFYSN